MFVSNAELHIPSFVSLFVFYSATSLLRLRFFLKEIDFHHISCSKMEIKQLIKLYVI